jgi:hypothetical protein
MYGIELIKHVKSLAIVTRANASAKIPFHVPK